MNFQPIPPRVSPGRRFRAPLPPPPVVEPLEGRRLFAAGDLDSAFGDVTDPGKVRVVVNQSAVPDDAAAASVLPDGKLLVVGRTGNPAATTEMALARLGTDGFPDTTFGTGGKVSQTFSGSQAAATSILTGSDGKIALVGGGVVVGGYANTQSSGTLQFALAKYNGNGTLDPTFGLNGGRVLTTFAGDAKVSGLLLTADGAGIIAVGTVGTGADAHIALARYDLNGQIDPTFGGDGSGTVLAPVSGDARAAVVLPNGAIIVAGMAADGAAQGAVFEPTGAFTISFEDTNLTGASALTVLPDSSLLLAGPSSAAIRPLDGDFAVVHRGQLGEPDTDFGGGDGVATIDVTGAGANDEAAAVALTPDSGPDGYKIVVAGSTNVRRNGGGTVVGSDFAVARLNPDGSADTDFGSSGARAQPFALFDSEGVQTVSTGKAVAVYPDGRIVVAGTVPSATLQPIGGGQRGVVTRFGLARFLGAGDPVGTASISGTFFNDVNRNGVRDAGEPAVAGMTAYFDRNDNAEVDDDEPKAFSGADGKYTIANLSPGRYYRIREIRGTLTRTLPAGAFPLGYYDLTLTAGQQSTGNDFGNFDPAVAGPTTNAAPASAADAATTDAGKSVDIDVLGNDSDDNSKTLLTVTVTRQPAHGLAVFNAAIRKVTYIPNADYSGPDGFGYTLKDTGDKSSAEAAVAVTVNPKVVVPPSSVSAMVTGTLPAAAVGGAKAKASVSVLVANVTALPIAGGLTINLFTSADDTLDANDAAVTTLAKAVKLKAGAGKTFKVKIPAFPAVADGTYKVLAKVTAPDGTFTVAPSAGSLVIAAPFVSLTPGVAGVFTKPLAAGGVGTATVQVSNTGNVPAAGAVTVNLYASADRTIGGDDVLITAAPLALKTKQGTSKKYKVKAALPAGLAAGNYFLVAKIISVGGVGGVPDKSDNATAVSVTPFTVL